MTEQPSDTVEKDPKLEEKKDEPESPEAKPKDPTPPKSPVQEELDKAKNKPKRTQREILDYNIDRLTKKRDALSPAGGNEPVVEDEEIDDDTPVTFGMLRKQQIVDATGSAKKLADEQVQDPDERELVKTYLETRIKPSGDPQKDFRDALALVNSVKNAQVAEELARKSDPKRTSSGSGAPAKAGDIFEPSAQEKIFMGPPFNLSKDDIIKSRPQQ